MPILPSWVCLDRLQTPPEAGSPSTGGPHASRMKEPSTFSRLDENDLRIAHGFHTYTHEPEQLLFSTTRSRFLLHDQAMLAHGGCSVRRARCPGGVKSYCRERPTQSAACSRRPCSASSRRDGWRRDTRINHFRRMSYHLSIRLMIDE